MATGRLCWFRRNAHFTPTLLYLQFDVLTKPIYVQFWLMIRRLTDYTHAAKSEITFILIYNA